ncbi:MAG: AMP-binding protein [Mycobacterium sp.]
MTSPSGRRDGFVPFPVERAQRYREAGLWAGRTVDSLLRDAARRWPQRTAVADSSTRLSFDEVDRAADRVASALHHRGVRRGERMLLQLPNTARFPVAFFGLLRAGIIPVMCLPGHRGGELGHFATVSDAVGLIVADRAAGFDYRPMAAELTLTHPGLRHVVVDGDPGEFTAWSELVDFDGAAPDPAEAGVVDTAAPALLLVSGGTTGYPKLIPRTHDDYVYNATASAALCRLTGDDVYLATLPAAHNFPLACPGLLGAVSVGATTVLLSDPSPESAFATIAAEGVTVTALVPALAKLWSQACDWEPVLPTTLRLLQVGGAKLGAEDAAAVRAALPAARLQQVFGMAEGLLNYTRLDDSDDLLDRTQGRPLSEADEIAVVDETGTEVAAGTEGELMVRGPYTINGYFNAEAVNRQSFSADGFYRTGDKVRRSADGYLEVTGRVKDVIHRAGETVSALDLEEHLLTHPAIWNVAVVALPDAYLGEKICAAVVFRAQTATLAQLHRFLDQRGVAAYARPDLLTPMSSLPTTAVGKVDKKAIISALTHGAQSV